MSKYKLGIAFLLFITLCTATAGASWTAPLYVTSLTTPSDISTMPPPPATYIRTFGINPSATNGFDINLDVSAPPSPQAGSLDAYFPSSHEVISRLATDIRSDAQSTTWTLMLTVPSDSTVRMDWDAGDVPLDKTLSLSTGTDNINMKTQGYTVFESGTYSLSIVANTPDNNENNDGGEGSNTGGTIGIISPETQDDDGNGGSDDDGDIAPITKGRKDDGGKSQTPVNTPNGDKMTFKTNEPNANGFLAKLPGFELILAIFGMMAMAGYMKRRT